jgi:nucleoredoxin
MAGFAELFPEELVNAKGEKVNRSTLEGKKVCIYFSAHWCPPCRGFTPTLVEFYQEVATNQGKPLEIVFVSSDRDEAAMSEYMQETNMPWLAVPFGSPHVAQLKKMYNITGIPTLVVLNSSGVLVSAQGRTHVLSKGPKAFESW